MARGQNTTETPPKYHQDVLSELARCDIEIASILARPDVAAGLAPAWLVTLGLEDWEAEKRIILRDHQRAAWGEINRNLDRWNQEDGR